MRPEYKRCIVCGEKKPEPCFGESRSPRLYLRNTCKDCTLYTIYALVDPRDSRIFYVGCTMTPKSRYMEHIYNANGHPERNPRKSQRINEIIRSKKRPILIELECVNEWHQKDREEEWIMRLVSLDAPLTNAKFGHPVRYYVDEF